MHHDLNYSTAYDIAVISAHCMRNFTFSQIVRTRNYTCESHMVTGH